MTCLDTPTPNRLCQANERPLEGTLSRTTHTAQLQMPHGQLFSKWNMWLSIKLSQFVQRWEPRSPIIMAISLYTPKQSKIDIVWHSMTQYRWQKHGESEDLPSRLGPKWSSWLLTAPVGFHLQSEWPGRSLLDQDLHLSRGHQSEVSNLSGKTHGLT